jgi:thioredoxin 1
MVQYDSATEITEEEFDEIINNSHELVVVDFFAEWCMPCLMISPVIEELAAQMSDIRFSKVNIDDNQGLAGKFRISSIPCLILFKQGKEVGRIIGAQTAETIEEKIRNFISRI